MGDTILKVSRLKITGGDSTILDGLNFAIKRGTVMAIVGPNGAGKTTLFRALLGLIPYSETIEWKKGIRMDYVPQGFLMTDIPITVREFISLKFRTDFTESRKTVCLEERILELHLGKLFRGEMHRVLLALSIVDSPDILLIDRHKGSWNTHDGSGGDSPLCGREEHQQVSQVISNIQHNN